MVEMVKGLRGPICTEIDGRQWTLLTVGYVAHALRRTVWTVKYWERIGLFPAAPFISNGDVPSTRLRLYPRQFVDALEEIVARGYLGKRLDRDDWRRFRHEVFAAYEETVTPLTGNGVTGTDPAALG